MQARFRKECGRAKELEVSKRYARCVVLSAEFLASYFVMIVFFAATRPFGTDVEEARLLMSIIWILGSISHYFLIASTLQWLVYFVMFRFGLVVYLIALIALYASTAVMSVELIIQILPYQIDLIATELGFVMVLIVSAMSISSVTSSMVMKHPIFIATDGEQHLFEMLPPGLRGKVLSASAEDHYVRVSTVHGETLVRAKFQTIVDLLKETNGMVIHRSHWIALDEIATVSRREHGGLVVQLKNGAEFHVSKSRAATFREQIPPSLIR